MTSILIAYSSTDGHTLKICSFIKNILENSHNQVELVSIPDNLTTDINSFDKVIIGASIRYGRHRPHVYDFISRHQHLLDNKANAFFSVNVVARKPGKNTPETNPYLRKFLNQISWQPKLLAVFAGKIDYPRYSFMDRNIIRLIMWLTNGPTNPDAIVEFTDWKQVQAFAESFDALS